MIVVDTNVVAFTILPGPRREDCAKLAGHDPAWVAPGLWRYELRNVLATAIRFRGLDLARAIEVFAAAEGLVREASAEPSTRQCLELAQRHAVSAYDAEFVVLAERLGVDLVTADRRLAMAFPERAVLLEEAVKRFEDS